MNPTDKWNVVTCAPTMFGEKQPERPYIQHNDMEQLRFHLVTTYKDIDPPTCLCGELIPEDIVRHFNFKALPYKIEPLPVPAKSGLII